MSESLPKNSEVLNHDLSEYPDFLTVEQVCTILQMHENTVRSLLNQGIIPGKKLSRKWVVSREALVKTLNEP